MPIYEYQCKSCGHQLEKIQKMSDAPLTDCPACEQPALYKKVSASGFRLKGAGWYETDFKKDGKRNLAGDSDSTKSESKSDSKDSKSESKSESSSSESKPKSDSGSSSSDSSSSKSSSNDKAA